jgi:hypothetical protein
MEKKIYSVDLLYYTDENVPECGTKIFISTTSDLTKIPKDVLKEDVDVQEALDVNDCESIGNVEETSLEEFEFYGDAKLIYM